LISVPATRDHVGASFGKAKGDRPSYARRTTNHYSDLSVKLQAVKTHKCSCHALSIVGIGKHGRFQNAVRAELLLVFISRGCLARSA
jgi:hypothetical protein